MPFKQSNFGTIEKHILTNFSMKSFLAKLNLHHIARMFNYLDDNRVEQATSEPNNSLNNINHKWSNHPFPWLQYNIITVTYRIHKKFQMEAALLQYVHPVHIQNILRDNRHYGKATESDMAGTALAIPRFSQAIFIRLLDQLCLHCNG